MIQGFLFHAKGTELETHIGEYKGHRGQQCDSSGIVVTEASGGPQTPSLPSPLLAEDTRPFCSLTFLITPLLQSSSSSSAAGLILRRMAWPSPAVPSLPSPGPLTGVTAVARYRLWIQSSLVSQLWHATDCGSRDES